MAGQGSYPSDPSPRGPPPPYDYQPSAPLPSHSTSRPSVPSSSGAASPQLSVPRDRLLVEDAIQIKLPQWTARVQAVLKAPVVFACDFNALTHGCTTEAERLKVVSPLVKGVDRIGGLVTEPPALEQFVRAVEVSLTDPSVVREVLERMPSLCIVLVNHAGANVNAKGLAFDRGNLVYTGVFARGQEGVLSQDQVETFFELNFFARERALVGRCMADTVPAVTARLKQATRRLDFILDFHLPRLLDGVTVREKRLATARLLVSHVGMSRKLDTAGKLADLGINNIASGIEKAVTGENEQFKRAPKMIDLEVYTSPHVLEPLVRAVEATCAKPDVARVVAQAIRGIVFQTLPPKSPRTLVLRQRMDHAVDIVPQPDGSLPCRDCWLVYAAPFEEGKSAVFSERECLIKLEEYFRGQEQSLVYGFLDVDLPRARDMVRLYTTPSMDIEIMWSTFFHDNVEPGAGRLEVAESVCGASSALLLKPFVNAFEAVATLTPGVDVPTVMRARITRIIIQSTPGKQAKASIVWGTASGGSNAAPLIYNCAADRAHRGFLATVEIKAALRNLLGLPVPKEETGAAAVLGKASAELGRIGGDVTKLFGRFSKPRK
eukprot:m.57170 g.57170  ORF g.57170 m.57170 type:complete len:605 (+) comp7734_c0_seq1:265-2079(+)